MTRVIVLTDNQSHTLRTATEDKERLDGARQKVLLEQIRVSIIHTNETGMGRDHSLANMSCVERLIIHETHELQRSGA
jgi:hypothetical protein